MATPVDLALEHYTDRLSFVDAAAQVAGQMWDQVNPARIVDSWAAQIPELTAVVSGAQLGVARRADPYVTDVLEADDLDAAAVAEVDPRGFASQASDARGLASLLTNPVFVTLSSIQDGLDITRALTSGRANLDLLVRTQVADAGRLADQAAITARPKATGYVRMAVGNSCARCLILSGKHYQWNTGFQRHPRCDCIHVPAGSRTALRIRSPQDVYASMSTVERLRAGFTRADQKAIAAGADLNQVVNARRGLATAGGRRFTTEGTTRRGVFGSARRGQRRLSVDQIYLEAGADRAEAIRLLHRNGYLLEPVPATLRTSVPAPAAAAVDPALGLTVAQLKQIARDANVPLFGATRKADIVVNLRNWESVYRVKIPGLPEWKPPPLARSAAVVQLGVPAANSPVLTGARLNNWSDEIRYGPLGPVADTPADGLRVKDLRVVLGAADGSFDAYVVATGTAWRFNGVSYLIEHGPDDFGAPWVSRALADLRAAHETIPAARRANKSYAVLQGPSKANSYWARRFNSPNHRSAMTAGGGHVTIYDFNPGRSVVSVNLLRHETGHNLDDLVGRRSAGSESLAWGRAAHADVAVANGIDFTSLSFDRTFVSGAGRGFPAGVTDYGRSSAGEDWAESVMLYQLGPIAKGRLVPGGDVVDLYFRDIYPNRAAILDDLFPELAAAQKAQIAAARGPDLSKLTVDKLRALARQRGIRLPARARKADIIEAIRAAEAPPLTGNAAIRAAARERQRQIARAEGTARLLAEIDELVAKNADAAIIRERLNPDLLGPEQLFANADPTVLPVLRRALDSGDPAKLRAAVARLTKKAGLTPVGSAGKTITFDPQIHDPLGPTPKPGTPVRVVRRGTTITMPDGEVIELAKAKVVAATRRPSDSAPPLGELIDRARQLNLEGRLQAIGPHVNGTYAGLQATVDETYFTVFDRDELLVISGTIAKGEAEIGSFSRFVGRDQKGRLYAMHGHLKIDRKYQGSGFAHEFNANLLSWYRRSGFDRVLLQANIDVGGYAWASAGYDFANAKSARAILDRLRRRYDKLAQLDLSPLDRDRREQIQALLGEAKRLLDRAAANRFGTPGFPTAFEVSQLGRQPGMGKRDRWLGKEAMLGSTWEAVLRL